MSTALMDAALRAYEAPENQHKHIDKDLLRAIVVEISKLDSCLGKVKTGEPIFVLRGQDLLSDGLVCDWALMARERGLGDEKYKHAHQVADAMKAWPERKYPD